MRAAPPLMLSVGMAFWLAVPATPATASTGTVEMRADVLSITVPDSVSLGSANPGQTISASLGTVTVGDTRLVLANWTATVTTTGFTTGAGSPPLTIDKGNVSYWSGPVTASSGIAIRIPGQLTALQAQSLSVSRTAFTKQAGVLGTTTSWNPTLVVAVPAAAIAGTYTGTVTHSVA